MLLSEYGSVSVCNFVSVNVKLCNLDNRGLIKSEGQRFRQWNQMPEGLASDGRRRRP